MNDVSNKGTPNEGKKILRLGVPTCVTQLMRNSFIMFQPFVTGVKLSGIDEIILQS